LLLITIVTVLMTIASTTLPYSVLAEPLPTKTSTTRTGDAATAAAAAEPLPTNEGTASEGTPKETTTKNNDSQNLPFPPADAASSASSSSSVISASAPLLVCETVGDEFESHAVATENTPSAAPSMAPPCSDPYSNARGVYSSVVAPCIISFHGADLDVDVDADAVTEEQPQTMVTEGGEGPPPSPVWIRGTSRMCGAGTYLGKITDYVDAWPDECVGDFSRCYDLGSSSGSGMGQNPHVCRALVRLLQRRRLQLQTAREGDHEHDYKHDSTNHYEHEYDFNYDYDYDYSSLIPPGTTHVSVDCTIDKDSYYEQQQQQKEREAAILDKRVRDALAAQTHTTLVVVGAILVSALALVVAVSLLVVRPIVAVLGEQRQRQWGYSGHGVVASTSLRRERHPRDTNDDGNGNGDSHDDPHDDPSEDAALLVLQGAFHVAEEIPNHGDGHGHHRDRDPEFGFQTSMHSSGPTDAGEDEEAHDEARVYQAHAHAQVDDDIRYSVPIPVPTPNPYNHHNHNHNHNSNHWESDNTIIVSERSVVPMVPATIVPLPAVVVSDGVTY